MFSNFKKAFINKPNFSDAIPLVIMDSMNTELPEGFYYEPDHDGFCRLDSKNGLEFQSGKIVLPEKAKGVLSERPTLEEVKRYSYNSQTPIKLEADEHGYILINGEKIKLNDMVKAPLQNIEIENSFLWMHPNPFPEPFKLRIGGDGYEKEVMISRKPNNSVYVQLFETINDSLMSIKYYLNPLAMEESAFTITMSIDIKNAKKVSEVVETYHIFNAFMDGKGTIGGVVIASDQTHPEKKVSDDTIAFWDKLYSLEKSLELEFEIEDGITVKDSRIMEELYRSLIEKKPFKTFRAYNSVTGTGGLQAIPEFETGQEIYLEIVSNGIIDFLGCTIPVKELKGIFAASMIRPEEKDIGPNGEYEIKITNVPGKKMYDSVQYYLVEEEMEEMRKNPEHIEVFRLAEEIHAIE